MQKCKKCGIEMGCITFSFTISGKVVSFLDHEHKVNLGVCKNADCVDFGVVRVLSNCSVHLGGHEFIQCDEWSATCVCGAVISK